MSQPEVVISVKDLVKNFGARRILNGVSMDIYAGETLVVMGGSGCGKSTFLRHLIGSIRPDSGEIWMFGKDIAKISDDEMHEVRKKYGMLFQSGALFDSMTVGENIALPLREHTKLDSNIVNIIVKMKLELVGLREADRKLPSQLSGGMRKRAALARAIALDPLIIFYDEPSSGLDPVATAVISQLINDMKNKMGLTNVVITHDIQSAFEIADHVVLLHRGKIAAQGSVPEILKNEDPLVRQFITGSATGPLEMRSTEGDYYNDLLNI